MRKHLHCSPRCPSSKDNLVPISLQNLALSHILLKEFLQNKLALEIFLNRQMLTSQCSRLRLKIWRLSYPGKQVINFGSAGHDLLNNPATLFINRESRSETLGCYRLLFSEPRYLYFNPNIDIVKFGRFDLGAWSVTKVIDKFDYHGGVFDHVKHITFCDIILLAQFPLQGGSQLYKFKALEKLHLVMHRYCPAHWGRHCRDELEQALQKHKAAFPDYKIPEVSLECVRDPDNWE
jgi:2EXR family